MSDGNEAARRAARANQMAEHRIIVQATREARRSGKLPRVSNGPSEVLTALAVTVVVVATLFLVFKYAN